jgi:hypothetical protein
VRGMRTTLLVAALMVLACSPVDPEPCCFWQETKRFMPEGCEPEVIRYEDGRMVFADPVCEVTKSE